MQAQAAPQPNIAAVAPNQAAAAVAAQVFGGNEWLGGEIPRANARTAREIGTLMSGIPKEERENLDAVSLNKLKGKATEGMEAKFAFVEPLNSNKASKEQLAKIYSVSMRVEEFAGALQGFDMLDVFTIPSAFVTDANGVLTPAANAVAINLFTEGQRTTIQQIKDACLYRMSYGATFHVQNLTWSAEKLLNSCDDALRQKIEELSKTFLIEHKTGPVLFKILMDVILASNEDSLRGLTTLLTKTNVKDFDGENVLKYTSFARGAIEQLTQHNRVPPDLLEIVHYGVMLAITYSCEVQLAPKLSER